MIDRQPTMPGRVKLTNERTGEVQYFIMERADSPSEVGTPLNRATLFDSMAESRSGVTTPSLAFRKLMEENIVAVPFKGWSAEKTDGYYTQQIAVEGMKAQYSPVYDLVITSAELSGYEHGAFAMVDKMETLDGSVVFYATGVPEVDMNVRIKGV